MFLYNWIRHNPYICDFANWLLGSSLLLRNPLYMHFHDKQMKKQMQQGLSVPQLLTVEISNRCNAKCINCPNEHLERAKGDMDISLLEKVLGEAKAMGVPRVNISGHGEPLVSKSLFEKLEIFGKYRFDYLTLTTNGSLLSLDVYKAAASAGVDTINISMDSGIPELYEKLRPGLSFEKIKRNIEICWQWKQEHGGPQINIQATLFEPEKNVKSALTEQFEASVDTIHVWRPHNWAGSLDGETPKSAQRLPCPQIWCAPIVFCDGNIPACCFDTAGKVINGNVKEASLDEIWRGTSFTGLRALHMEGKMDKVSPCDKCSVVPNWWINFKGV